MLEQTELQQHEAVIGRGLQTFVEVGNALMAIRDSRLYRATHRSFEEYCKERWAMTYRHANRLIGAASVIQHLGQISPIVPANVEQANPLASLPPETQPLAWQEAVDTAPGGKITGLHVASVVERYKPPVVPSEPEPDIDQETGEILDSVPDEPIWTPPVLPNRAYKNSSESNEWYTPANLIQKATSLLGVINLDPASSELANQTVQARQIYTIDDDGLTRQWVGNVWCNPPYGDDVARFVEKMIAEYESGHILEGLLLVAARTDTQWFRKLRRFPRCFLWGRVKFIASESGEAGDPAGFPSMIVYFGSHPDNFVETFEDIGDVYALWGTV